MSQVPEHLRYRETHEWFDPQTGAVGITDHAQAELTDVVYVELPKAGTKVESGAQVAVVESVKAASDIYAPVAGEIVEVNEALTSDPSLLNTEPYGRGWIFKLRPASGDAGAGLLDAAAYRARIG